MNRKKIVVLFTSSSVLIWWVIVSGVLLLDYLVPLLMKSVNENPEFYRYFIWFLILGGSLLSILIILDSEYMSQFSERP